MTAALAVARHRHFQRAAAELGTTQPALSRMIRALEEELGECLFDRGRGRVELTPVGERFIAFAADLTGRRARQLADIRALISARRGLVTIACLPSLAVRAALLAGEFCAARPQVAARLLECPADQALAAVRAGDADLGLGVAPADARDLRTAPFHEDILMAAAAADHPLMRRKRPRWADLAEVRLIAMGRGSSVRRRAEQAFARAGRPFQPTMEVNLMSTAAALAAAGRGVAVLPSSFTDHLRDAAVAARPLTPEARRRLFLFRRRDRRLLPAALDMESFLLDHRPS